jgi:hypothetical protein
MDAGLARLSEREGLLDDGGCDDEVIAAQREKLDRIAPADQQRPRGDADFVVAL